ncbi:MAG: OmpA family protein [Candidatus Kapabacteria bacterium]|nr:OmpA family protein [Candidatus Kapabacteria bacterium]
MKKLILILTMLPILMYSQQDTNRLSFGIFGGFGLNFHSADFKKIPDCPSCSPGYKDGFGSGINGGLILDIPLFDQFVLSNKFMYKDISGKLVSTETTQIIVESVIQDGEFEHSLDADLSVIGFEPSIKYSIYKNLRLNVGILVSFLMSKNYSQVERITKPTDFATFLDADGNDTKSRERNKFSGEMKAANSIFIAPMLSVSYKMPMDRSGELFLEPEAMFHYGLTNIVNDELVNKWAVNSLSFCLALKYSPLSKPDNIEEYKRIEHIDTIKINTDLITESKLIAGKETVRTTSTQSGNVMLTTDFVSRTDTIFSPVISILDASISAFGVSQDGVEIKNPVFKIEEFVLNRLDPLLNYIFFEENSSEMSKKYKMLRSEDIDDFNIDSLYQISTLDIYYNILNIIGVRLNKFPDAGLTIIGCNSDLSIEKGNTALSQKRAEFIKQYLVNVWNISDKRIAVKAQNLSDKASTPYTEPDKIQENRRAEIYSDDYRILEPVFIENIQRTSNPPIARFKSTSNSNVGLKNWEIKAYQDESKELDTFKINGTNNPPVKYDWQLENDQLTVPKLKNPIKYILTVTDNKGKTFTTDNQELAVEVIKISEKRVQRIDDYEIEKFSLILFDFDKSNIESNNKKIIDYISKRIKPESIIEIKGYTDRTGDAQYNMKLSEKRAGSVKSALNRDDAKSIGIGEQEFIYNNDIPEGRFYSRTVEVTVKNKVK